MNHFQLLLIIAIGFFSLPSCQNEKEVDKETAGRTTPVPMYDPLRLKDSGGPGEAVENRLKRWDDLAASLKGDKAFAAREEVISEALFSLDGPALGEFILGLHDRRAGEPLDRLVEEGSKKMFTGDYAPAARAWLSQLEDADLQDRLCFPAGYHYSGPGFAPFLATIETARSKDRLLTGYACGLAETDPVHAIREFFALRPPGVSNYGLKEIMRHLPENADFKAVNSMYPDDSKDLAREIRTEMLKRWAEFAPDKAAELVISHPETIRPQQLGPIFAVWMASSPDDAEAWLNSRPAGEANDLAHGALASHLAASDHRKAWRHAASVGDSGKRVEAATAVFKEWEKTDRPGATEAWLELFPSGN